MPVASLEPDAIALRGFPAEPAVYPMLRLDGPRLLPRSQRPSYLKEWQVILLQSKQDPDLFPHRQLCL
jgi:hypothetical protein